MTTLALMLFLVLIYQIFAEDCGNNLQCIAPHKCCEYKTACCPDGLFYSRLQIWNMWYFWFLIIFMMMSCFGGCGYYRRRRLAMLTRSSAAQPTRPNVILTPCQRAHRTTIQDGNRQFNFFAYSGPGFNGPEAISNLPPAYSEVVNEPALYSLNKVELPPYPGNYKPEDSHIMSTHGDNSMPPAYTEIHFDSTQAFTASQNSMPQHTDSAETDQQETADGVNRGYSNHAMHHSN